MSEQNPYEPPHETPVDEKSTPHSGIFRKMFWVGLYMAVVGFLPLLLLTVMRLAFGPLSLYLGPFRSGVAIVYYISVTAFLVGAFFAFSFGVCWMIQAGLRRWFLT